MSTAAAVHPTLGIPVWARIKLGTHSSPSALRDAVQASGKTTKSALEAMIHREFTVEPLEREVELYRVPISRFSFERNEYVHGSMVPSHFVLKHGRVHGFDAIVPEVGPQVWRQRPDIFASFSAREWVQFAMEPINYMVFNIVTDEGPPFLTANWGDCVQPLSEQYVFAKYV